jgi:hypothetical protein
MRWILVVYWSGGCLLAVKGCSGSSRERPEVWLCVSGERSVVCRMGKTQESRVYVLDGETIYPEQPGRSAGFEHSRLSYPPYLVAGILARYNESREGVHLRLLIATSEHNHR